MSTAKKEMNDLDDSNNMFFSLTHDDKFTIKQLDQKLNTIENNIKDEYSKICEKIESDVKFTIKQLDQQLNTIENNIKDEYNKIWKKIESLDQRINDNFKYLTGIMITLFSGLYATALGGMLLRLCKYI